MPQRIVYGKGVHLSAHSFTRFQRCLQEMAGNLDCKGISDDFAGSLLVLGPCEKWQRNPYRAPVNDKLDINGVRMTRCDGHNQRLVNAVDPLLGPVIGRLEVVEHDVAKL
jgi:hypothetical protein